MSTRRRGNDGRDLTSMGAMVMACWMCWKLSALKVDTPKRLARFHKHGPLCIDCLKKWRRLYYKGKKLGEITE